MKINFNFAALNYYANRINWYVG